MPTTTHPDNCDTSCHCHPEEIADEQIEALRDEAANAGDLAQVDVCTEAMSGDAAARAECARVIREAEVRS